MEIHLNMAPSFNGIISHSDGSEEYISDNAWNLNEQLAEKTGAIIVGRKTIEAVESWNDNKYSLDKIKARSKVVVTNNQDYIRPGWLTAHSPKETIAMLEAQGHGKAQLIGGSALAGSFMNEKLISKVYFLFQPWIVNEGIPLVSKLNNDIKLHVTHSELQPTGEVLIEANAVY